mmetsp:Transcript_8266/g.19443  ORF Transcript_8266/g.19443 Transcript_8266/m.19443 type:complete len:218 (-) Transcript_8266:224-877(-)
MELPGQSFTNIASNNVAILVVVADVSCTSTEVSVNIAGHAFSHLPGYVRYDLPLCWWKRPKHACHSVVFYKEDSLITVTYFASHNRLHIRRRHGWCLLLPYVEGCVEGPQSVLLRLHTIGSVRLSSLLLHERIKASQPRLILDGVKCSKRQVEDTHHHAKFIWELSNAGCKAARDFVQHVAAELDVVFERALSVCRARKITRWQSSKELQSDHGNDL